MKKTKPGKAKKKYNAVKEMRRIRDKISSEISGMTSDQIIAYFRKQKPA